MPVDSVHAEYSENQLRWQRCRDVFAGDKVKAAGVAYLPMLEGMTRVQYAAYLLRALFFNAMRRTVIGLVGAIFRKEAVVHVPAALTPHLADITMADDSFEAFVMKALEELLVVGRAGVLVEMPLAGTDNARPYWVRYAAEQILNWKTSNVRGDSILVRVVLREWAIEEDTDRFTDRRVEQVRVLELVDGVYTVSIWRQHPRTHVLEEIEDMRITPTRRGQPLPFIPFTFFGPSSIGPGVEWPPLLDLVDVNLSHYRSSADLEHGRHFTALPTPYVTGVKSNTTNFQIGPAIAWKLENPQSKVGMLEFSGQGLGALEKALESKERMMQTLGARLLESRPSIQESFETVRARHQGDHAVVKTIALTLGYGVSQLLRTHAWWLGLEPTTEQPIAYLPNLEFFDMRLSAQEVQALVMSWQADAISFETLFHNLQRGDVARPGVDVEAERHAIAANRVILEGED